MARSRAGLPLSGSESAFTNVTFGGKRGIRNNNCYAWAIDSYADDGARKLQPGNLSSTNAAANAGADMTRCQTVAARAARDLRGRAYPATPEAPCRKGYYKIMSFVSEGRDFHWYRQHKDALVRLSDNLRDTAALARALGVRPDQVYSPSPVPRPGDTVLVKDAGLWSHKRGFATAPILKDACGKAIRDPRKACRRYDDLDYSKFCGAMCVKARP